MAADALWLVSPHLPRKYDYPVSVHQCRSGGGTALQKSPPNVEVARPIRAAGPRSEMSASGAIRCPGWSPAASAIRQSQRSPQGRTFGAFRSSNSGAESGLAAHTKPGAFTWAWSRHRFPIAPPMFRRDKQLALDGPVDALSPGCTSQCARLTSHPGHSANAKHALHSTLTPLGLASDLFKLGKYP